MRLDKNDSYLPFTTYNNIYYYYPTQNPTITYLIYSTSLRSLMPGRAQEANQEDRSLDQSFRADKIEFVVVSRIAMPDESTRKQQLIDVNMAEWDIPSEDEFNDAMGLVIDKYTETDLSLIHTICWSSVNKSMETGVFSIKTGALKHIEDFRELIRRMFVAGKCYESFPRLALLKKFQLYFPKSCAKVKTRKLCDLLMDCNEGLRGEVAPLDVKYFPEKHQRHGARIVILSGTQDFLDFLQRFPKDFPFAINMANVYIRGGTRTDETRGNAGIRRPKIARKSIEDLVKRNMEALLKSQNFTEDDKLAFQFQGTNIGPDTGADNFSPMQS